MQRGVSAVMSSEPLLCSPFPDTPNMKYPCLAKTFQLSSGAPWADLHALILGLLKAHHVCAG